MKECVCDGGSEPETPATTRSPNLVELQTRQFALEMAVKYTTAVSQLKTVLERAKEFEDFLLREAGL